MTVTLNGQTNKPAEVDEEEGPVDRYFEHFKEGACPGDYTDGTNLFPEIKLSNGPDHGSIKLHTFQTEIRLDKS